MHVGNKLNLQMVLKQLYRAKRGTRVVRDLVQLTIAVRYHTILSDVTQLLLAA